MLNNCTNVLVVRGEREEIIRFSEYCRLFEGERKNENEKTSDDLGKRLNVDFEIFDKSEEELTIKFYTSSCPAEQWFIRVSSMFPHLNFLLKYYELGNRLVGYLTSNSGGSISAKKFLEWSDAVEFLYGAHNLGLHLDKICEDCINVEVEIEEIISYGYVICTKCFQRQKDEGSVA